MSAFDYLSENARRDRSWEWAKGVALAIVIGVALAWRFAIWSTCEGMC